jgi:hypothetical protein
MPMHSVIYKEHRLVVTTGEGRVSLDDVLAHQDRLQRDPDFNPEFDQLVDTTGITDVSLSVHEIKRVVNHKLFSPNSRIALVAVSSFMYGMLRMTQTYQELSNSKALLSIFRDQASALQWLGIPKDSGLF